MRHRSEHLARRRVPGLERRESGPRRGSRSDRMTPSFPQWLAEIGLARYQDVFLTNGIDFASACHLTRDDLRQLGLNLGDSLTFLHAIEMHRLSQRRAGADFVGVLPAASSFTEEVRLLTVMFCDLVGYTALSHRLGHLKDRKLVHLRERFVAACETAVKRNFGRVKQVQGDGVMVYFGWPA